MGTAMTVYLSVKTNLLDSRLTCYTESAVEYQKVLLSLSRFSLHRVFLSKKKYTVAADL